MAEKIQEDLMSRRLVRAFYIFVKMNLNRENYRGRGGARNKRKKKATTESAQIYFEGNCLRLLNNKNGRSEGIRANFNRGHDLPSIHKIEVNGYCPRITNIQ